MVKISCNPNPGGEISVEVEQTILSYPYESDSPLIISDPDLTYDYLLVLKAAENEDDVQAGLYKLTPVTSGIEVSTEMYTEDEDEEDPE